MPRILVVGCGGIGGVTTASLAELGADVTALSRNPDVVAAVADRGLRLVGEAGERNIPARVVHQVQADERFDYVLLATQPTDVEDAARRALPNLAPDGRMVCFQNGLCEERVARVLGDPGRVIGGIVAWGATMPEPGLFDKTAAGGFVLGRLDGAPDDRLQELATLLEAIGPVQHTDNLTGARWSKLAINCTITTLGALGGERLGPLVAQRMVRRLALEIMTEVVAVARALRIELVKVSGTLDLNWIALTDEERMMPYGSVTVAAKHAMLLAVGMRYRRLKSSMLRAIERGDEPAIDYLNGEVVARAQALGIDVPVNRAFVERIRDIAQGRATPGAELLTRIHAATAHVRPQGAAPET